MDTSTCFLGQSTLVSTAHGMHGCKVSSWMFCFETPYQSLSLRRHLKFVHLFLFDSHPKSQEDLFRWALNKWHIPFSSIFLLCKAWFIAHPFSRSHQNHSKRRACRQRMICRPAIRSNVRTCSSPEWQMVLKTLAARILACCAEFWESWSTMRSKPSWNKRTWGFAM